jgi:hypothetical protein
MTRVIPPVKNDGNTINGAETDIYTAFCQFLSTEGLIPNGNTDGLTGGQVAEYMNIWALRRSSNFNNATASSFPNTIILNTKGTFTPIKSLVADMIFIFKATANNTAECTINIDGLGEKDLKTKDGVDLTANNIVANSYYIIQYNGTEFKIISILKATQDEVNSATDNDKFVTPFTLQNKLATIANKKPYSVNSSKMTSGLPDFIQIDNNNQITILADLTNPLVTTSASNNTEILTTSQVIPIGVYDGIYTIIKEDGGNAEALQTRGDFHGRITGGTLIDQITGLDWSKVSVGQIITGTNVATSGIVTVASFIPNVSITMSIAGTNSAVSAKSIDFRNIQEDNALPTTNLADGMYAVTINPLKCYKRVSGAWQESTMKKLGEVQKVGGIIGSPVNYALNGVSIITLTNPSENTNIQINHNIGSDFITHEQWRKDVNSPNNWIKYADFTYQNGPSAYVNSLGTGCEGIYIDKNRMIIIFIAYLPSPISVARLYVKRLY